MAKRNKSQAKAKETKKQANSLLAKVPEEYVFYCCDGKVFADLQELSEGLATMSDEVFAYHVNAEKNDFCNWVRGVIKDETLAADLAAATNRLQTVGLVTSRMASLRHNLQ
jgi:hypothetical protein